MKITGVESKLFVHGMPARTSCLLELRTDTSLYGLAVVRTDVRSSAAEIVRSVLAGEDPRAVVGLWERMIGNSPEAVAALDIALWDLKAKINDEPLWKTLGGARPKMNSHAAGVAGTASDAALAGWCDSMARDFGFRAGMLRAGMDAGADLRRLEIMQRALPTLMIDAGAAWTAKDAIRRLRGIEKQFDVTWVEAPVQSWDFLGMKRVSGSIRAAVCAGARASDELLPHLHEHSIDIIRIDVLTTGITGSMQIADAAFGFELPVVLGASPGNIAAHLSAAMPYSMSLEVEDPRSDDGILATDVRVEQGFAVAGDGVGNGLRISDT